MRIDNDIKLDFKDVLIKPKRSTLKTRKDVSVLRTFKFLYCSDELTSTPIIAANMDGVGTFTMSASLTKRSALTALTKHYNINELINYYINFSTDLTLYSLGISENDIEKFNYLKGSLPSGFQFKVRIDVANGYTQRFVDFIKKFRDDNPSSLIFAGNVATGEMTEELILSGADVVVCGIGPGAQCITRQKTGVGVPQLSAVIECADAAHGLGGHLVSDGGCKYPSDIAKALGAGADFVMLGTMLAGHDECEEVIVESEKHGTYVEFYGMSSELAQKNHRGKMESYKASEGIVSKIPYKGSVNDTINDIYGSLRSTCTYVGAKSIKELTKRTTFVKIT